MCHLCFIYTPLFTVSLAFDKCERSCESYISYLPIIQSAQVSSEPFQLTA